MGESGWVRVSEWAGERASERVIIKTLFTITF